MRPVLFAAHRGMLPCFYALSEGKCCFASDIWDRFEQELPFEKMLLIQNNSISVPYFIFAE